MIRDKVRNLNVRIARYLNSIVKFGSSILNRRFSLMQSLYLLVIILFMAGIVNAVFFPVANQGFIIYPQQGAQSIPETFVDVFVIGLGALGVYLSYIAGRQTTRGRLVSTYLLLSLFLLFLAVVVGIYVFATK